MAKIKPVTPRGRGRPRYCFTYEEAKRIVQSEGIQTKKDYEKWYLYNLPSRIPKRPDRAYRNCGFSWQDYLGKEHKAPFIRKKYRAFDEARKFAMSLGFKSKIDWIAFAKTKECPTDIPSRPDLKYKKTLDWVSWKHWLGYDLAQRHEVLTEALKPILYIVKVPNRPANVYKINVLLGQIETLLQSQRNNQIRIVRCFHMDKMEDNWKNAVSKFCSPYYNAGEDHEYSSANIAMLISELSHQYYSVILP